MIETKIDTEALTVQLNRLIKVRDKLKEMLDNIRKENNILKDHWESKTSNSVFTNFEDFYVGFQGQIENLDSDIAFLESTITNYKNYEAQANKHIDENIAI